MVDVKITLTLRDESYLNVSDYGMKSAGISGVGDNLYPTIRHIDAIFSISFLVIPGFSFAEHCIWIIVDVITVIVFWGAMVGVREARCRGKSQNYRQNCSLRKMENF